MTRVVKVSLWLSGAGVFAFLGLLVYLLVSEGASKDQMRASAWSPNGRFVAELHTVIAPVHGGPDTLYLAIRDKNEAFGETVFSRVYECDDANGFNIRWTGAETLNVSSGECDTGHSEEDRVHTKQMVWRGIAIKYFDTHDAGTH